MKHYITLLAAILIILFTIPCSAASITLDDLNIHGFVSQGFLYTTHNMNFLTRDSENGTFDFNEMAVNFSVNPSDNLNLGMQLYAFDLGDIGNDNVEVDWAYGSYSLNDYLGVQVGIMKIPFGLYNEVRKIDMVRTSILLPTSVYPEWFRETFARIKGVGLSGTLPGNLSYQAMYGNVHIPVNGGQTDALESLLSDLGMDTTETRTNFAYAGKLQWDSPFGLKLAASFYSLDGLELDMESNLALTPEILVPLLSAQLGEEMGAQQGGQLGALGLTTPLKGDLVFEKPVECYVLSAEYMTERLTLAAEYTEWDLDFTVYVRSTMDPQIVAAMQIPTQVGDKTTFQGYYGSIAYRVLDRLEIGTYYSKLYYDKHDRAGHEFSQKYDTVKYDAWIKDLCLSARYDFSPSWCGKIEGHMFDGTFMSMNAKAKDWGLFAAKVTYSF